MLEEVEVAGKRLMSLYIAPHPHAKERGSIWKSRLSLPSEDSSS